MLPVTGVPMKLRAGNKLIPVQIVEHAKTMDLKCPYNKVLVSELKMLKGAQWRSKEKCWRVSKCRRNEIQLGLLQDKVPEEIARYDLEPVPVTPRRDCLYQHQRDMLDFVVARKRCILAAEMGTGKSLVAIELMERVPGKWLYVAPKKVLVAIERELHKWGCQNWPAMVNYAMLRRAVEEWDGPAPVGVIFDESSRLKTPGADRTEAAQHIADAIREEHDGHVVLMTGTPAPRNPCDWWSQAEIACPGFLRESTRAHLEKRLANYELLELEDKQLPVIKSWKMDEVAHLRRRLKGLVHVVMSADCQSLPPIRYERVELVPDKPTRQAARLIAERSINAVAALNSLRQLSDGFQYRDGKTIRVSCPKDYALGEILDTHAEAGRLIVYAGYTASVDRCVEICRAAGWQVIRCDGRGWLNQDLLSEMDRGTDTGGIEKIAFVAHPGSGGMGLTLTAAPAAVYFSNDFNFESRSQSEKRGHREGMGRGFTIFDLCHLPTDALILANLKEKKTLQAVTLERVRECLST